MPLLQFFKEIDGLRDLRGVPVLLHLLKLHVYIVQANKEIQKATSSEKIRRPYINYSAEFKSEISEYVTNDAVATISHNFPKRLFANA